MVGLTLKEWGPGAWNTLHAFAHSAPEALTSNDADRFAQFLRLFAAHLPCPTCRRHFSAFLERRMTASTLSTRAGIVALLNDAHNEVNARTGKRIFSIEEHYRMYSLRSDVGRQRTMETVIVVVIGIVLWRLVNRFKGKKVAP